MYSCAVGRLVGRSTRERRCGRLEFCAANPIEDSGEASGLERSTGLFQLTAIGLGAIIGAGIFALAGPVAKNDSGPAVSVSFILAGTASACAALAYAEFGGLIPRAGSAYTYG